MVFWLCCCTIFYLFYFFLHCITLLYYDLEQVNAKKKNIYILAINKKASRNRITKQNKTIAVCGSDPVWIRVWDGFSLVLFLFFFCCCCYFCSLFATSYRQRNLRISNNSVLHSNETSFFSIKTDWLNAMPSAQYMFNWTKQGYRVKDRILSNIFWKEYKKSNEFEGTTTQTQNYSEYSMGI